MIGSYWVTGVNRSQREQCQDCRCARVDFLLGNPLTSSAEIKPVRTKFVLDYEGALTNEQKSEMKQHDSNGKDPVELLPQLDGDESTAVPAPSYSVHSSISMSQRPSKMDRFFFNYMQRPLSLSPLSASAFHASYDVRKVGARRKHIDGDTLLINSKNHMVTKRAKPSGKPWPTHILNVTNRGPSDENLPQFAVAAIALHVPFRSVDELLGEKRPQKG